jgi:D-methionine transport system ATP-binding protein
MALIEVEHLSKDFSIKDGSSIHAVHDVSFSIEKGEIFGVIGLSGAGKSTLVRCLNLLERPNKGSVRIDGRDLVTMSEAELRRERRSIGMIFQHFNLLMQRNVQDNVCFPMEIAGMKRKEAREKALFYLQAVGLSEKAKAYPAQLSGGQQQRVAIARVLASNPEILLCDEATSALDPQTTREVLALLKKINQEYGITIVVITHAMSVIEEICDRVAVLEKGRLVEIGAVKDVFTNPSTDAAKRLLLTKRGEELLLESEEGR